MGIASERDLHSPVNPLFPKIDLGHIRAKDVASFDSYLVEMDTQLDQVVTKMAESRIGSAVVIKKIVFGRCIQRAFSATGRG